MYFNANDNMTVLLLAVKQFPLGRKEEYAYPVQKLEVTVPKKWWRFGKKWKYP